MKVFDRKSSQFRRPLAETIAWCAALTIAADVKEPAEVLNRRALIEEAGRLMQKANGRGQTGGLVNNFLANREYKRAKKLLTEADPESITPLREQLRSPELRPRKPLSEATESEREAVVREVIAARSVRLRLKKPIAPAEGNFDAGRLLLYVPEENLADGAATYRSKGFFDVNSTPPWDIWVSYSDRTLVSWVPRVLWQVVDAGIEASIEGCIRWADEGD